MLRTSFNNKAYNHTFGCLDTVQVTQMAKYLSCIYVSGWQSSSTASTTNEPGPDFADYPANTVPNKVEQLFKMQQFQDRRQKEERSRMSREERINTAPIDYMRPIIADGDTGFGGVTSVMKLIKMMVEAGASGVHIEDQKGGAKKCGHLAGKVLVSMREHVTRMQAARLQADVMGVELVLISRTDAEAATLLDNNIDPRDHAFIAGTTNKDIGTLADYIEEQAKKGIEYYEAEQAWISKANLCRYPDCVADAMKKAGKSQNEINSWKEQAMTLSNTDARALAKKLGFDVYWNWDACRVVEGYYRVIPGIDYSAARAVAFSPYSDIIWMETKKPILKDAEIFHNYVHSRVPHQMLAYNLSPSFNWDAAGFKKDQEIAEFQIGLGKLGFCWQFITLAGFHQNALAIDQFAKAYAGPEGVLAYVKYIQREEARLDVETLTHQKWSGTELLDKQMNTATGGKSSTTATKGSTEGQFKKAKL